MMRLAGILRVSTGEPFLKRDLLQPRRLRPHDVAVLFKGVGKHIICGGTTASIAADYLQANQKPTE